MGLYDRDYGKFGEKTAWDRAQNPKSMVVILIIVTVAIFMVDMITSPQGEPGFITKWGAVSGDTLLKPWLWWQFLSYGFVHAQGESFPRHVLFNMFALFVFGRAVEQRLGRFEFLRFYLISIVIGGIAAAVYAFAAAKITGDPNYLINYTIGASGAVIAVTILFACFYPNQELLLMFVLPVKAWVLAVFFVVYDLAGAFGVLGQGSHTAFQVHLSGALFGFLYFQQGWNLRWLDFTAVGSLPKKMRQRSRRMKLKLHDPDKKIERDANEADRLLDKVFKQGEASLTPAERKVLERHSKQQRKKRDQG